MAETEESGVMSLTVTLLSAYFANNTVPSSELPALVEGTRKALLGGALAAAPAAEETATAPISVEAAAPAAAPAPVPEFKPAVSIDASLASHDQILSMIDGKPYKALKRHLSTHGLTPAEYRARYGLPGDYPMVAPGYSAARREVALKLGLGGKRKAVVADPAPAPSSDPAPLPEPAEAVAEKPSPVRKARAKASPAKASPTTSKSKAANGKGKPAAADTVAKSKRSRAPKVDAGSTAPVEAAPVAAAGEEPAGE
jgi:predicted transcriptional regulator